MIPEDELEFTFEDLDPFREVCLSPLDFISAASADCYKQSPFRYSLNLVKN